MAEIGEYGKWGLVGQKILWTGAMSNGSMQINSRNPREVEMFAFTSGAAWQQNGQAWKIWSLHPQEKRQKQPNCRHQHAEEPFCTPAYRNTYEHCGTSWDDEWSCMCNDRCPVCNAEIEPTHSEQIASCACAHLD
jgi:hypothetical protein